MFLDPHLHEMRSGGEPWHPRRVLRWLFSVSRSDSGYCCQCGVHTYFTVLRTLLLQTPRHSHFKDYQRYIHSFSTSVLNSCSSLCPNLMFFFEFQCLNQKKKKFKSENMGPLSEKSTQYKLFKVKKKKSHKKRLM